MFPESGCPPAGKNSIPHHTGGIQLVQGNLQRPGQRWCTVPLQRDSRLMPETQNYLHGFHLFFCFKTLQGLLFQSSAFLFCLFGFLIVRKKGIGKSNSEHPWALGRCIWRAQTTSTSMHFSVGFGCPCPSHMGNRTTFETPVSSVWLSLGLFVALLMALWEKKQKTKPTQSQDKGLSNAKSPNARSGLLFRAFPAKTLICKCCYDTTNSITASIPT